MDPFLGQIQLFAFGYAPQGWMLCDGAQLQITQNTALYSLIGTTYGGNGSSYFNIPNLINASPVKGMSFYIAVQGLYPQRQ
jgi:microcystin-dependent protein